jgi:hypothetical protein
MEPEDDDPIEHFVERFFDAEFIDACGKFLSNEFVWLPSALWKRIHMRNQPCPPSRELESVN